MTSEYEAAARDRKVTVLTAELLGRLAAQDPDDSTAEVYRTALVFCDTAPDAAWSNLATLAGVRAPSAASRAAVRARIEGMLAEYERSAADPFAGLPGN